MKNRNKFGEEASLYARKDFGIKNKPILWVMYLSHYPDHNNHES